MIETFAFIVSIVIFAIGAIGLIFNCRNLISVLIAIELMLLASNFNFVIFAHLYGVEGYVFSMFVLAVAAAEAAVGLAIILTYYRNVGNIDVAQVNHLKE